MYCVGKSGSSQTPVNIADSLGKEADGGNTVTQLLLIPAEGLLKPGDKIDFKVRAFNALGQEVENFDSSKVSLNVEGSGSASGLTYTATKDAQHVAATITATMGDVSGTARVRVVPPLPWKFDFDELSDPPVTWVGARYRHVIRPVDGSPALTKITTIPKGARSRAWMGHSDLAEYTMTADVKGSRMSDQLPDIGLTNMGYVLDLMGNSQQLQIRTWSPQLRMASTVDFPWNPDKWYRMKFRSELDRSSVTPVAICAEKFGPRDEQEPEEWTVVARDESPNLHASPGLYGEREGGRTVHRQYRSKEQRLIKTLVMRGLTINGFGPRASRVHQNKTSLPTAIPVMQKKELSAWTMIIAATLLGSMITMTLGGCSPANIEVDITLDDYAAPDDQTVAANQMTQGVPKSNLIREIEARQVALARSGGRMLSWGSNTSGWNSNMSGWNSNMSGWNSNMSGWNSNMSGWNSNMSGWNSNMSGWNSNMSGWNSNMSGWNSNMSGWPPIDNSNTTAIPAMPTPGKAKPDVNDESRNTTNGTTLVVVNEAATKSSGAKDTDEIVAELGGDWPQWGGTRVRNNVPTAKNLAKEWNTGKFDRRTGEWIRARRRTSCGTPILAAKLTATPSLLMDKFMWVLTTVPTPETLSFDGRPWLPVGI